MGARSCHLAFRSTSQGQLAATVISFLLAAASLAQANYANPDADNLKKSFEDWKTFEKRSHGGTTAPSTASPSAAALAAAAVSPTPSVTAAGAARVTFDDAKQPTVSRPDGVTVAFADPQIKVSGYQGRNYILRYEKATGSRFLQNVYGPSHVGTSVSGSGEQYLVEGGGVFFDSGTGGVTVANSRYGMDKNLLLPKQRSQIVMDAVSEVRAAPGHKSFKPTGYDPIKEVSEYKLYADGSRH